MGPTKVVLDTNILISALKWEGKPYQIFKKCSKGELELITSHAQLSELGRVMEYAKLRLNQEEKEIFWSLMLKIATIVDILGMSGMVKDDPTDDCILETALVGKAEYLISGDPHLLKLGEYQGVKIVTAHEFLEKISP